MEGRIKLERGIVIVQSRIMGVMIVLLMDHREVIIKDAMKVPVQVRSIDPSNLLFRDFLFIILNTYTSVHIVRPQFLK